MTHPTHSPASNKPPVTTRRLSSKRRKKKPEKPYPDFPLTPRADGRWCKKINGSVFIFGKKGGTWQDALTEYERDRDSLYKTGRKAKAQPEGLNTADLCNKFLHSKRQLVTTGELTERSWKDYETTSKLILEQFGRTVLVTSLTPDDFEKLRASLAETRGPVALGNEIQRVRVVFKYAFDHRLIPAPVAYGQGFKRPSKKTLRLNRAAKGPRMFERKELAALLLAADAQLEAMILLGINAGFGNADVGRLTRSAIDLAGGWVNYPRPKTGVPRRCPLWPETAAALKEVIDNRKQPADPADADLVFVTKYGASWAKETTDNPVSKEMAKLMKALDINGHRGFYALRHTFETVGGETRDQAAVDHIMGHARDDMASVYRERISDERLKAVTETVRAWLFGGKEVR